MKEAIKVDLNGKYIEPVIVNDSVSSVLPQYVMPEQEYDVETGDPIGDTPEPILDHYIVAFKAVDGLYEPTFDLVGYDQARTKYEEDYKKYLEQLNAYDPESELEPPTPPVAVDGSSFWKNGLTDEEIEDLKPVPVPTELELLTDRVEVVEIESTNTQLALVESYDEVLKNQEDINTTQLGLTTTYEELLAAQQETTDAQLALVDVYEQLLALQDQVAQLTKQLEVK